MDEQQIQKIDTEFPAPDTSENVQSNSQGISSVDWSKAQPKKKKHQKFKRTHPTDLDRDWGVYLRQNIQYTKASRFFDRSIQGDPKKFQTCFESAKCKLKQNYAKEALSDINTCLSLKPTDFKAKHLQAECLAQLNQIESAFSEAHHLTSQRPTDASVQHTKNALEISLQKTLSDSGAKILRRFKWKLKRHNIESNEMPPRSQMTAPLRAHREQAIELLKLRAYFDTSFAEQVAFWADLKGDKTLDTNIHAIIDRIIANLYSNQEILYTREPFYAKRDRFDRSSLMKARRYAFYSAQEETRRQAMWQLKSIQNMAKTNLPRALKQTEHILSQFYAVKRRIVFPEKLQFITEICYFVAMQYKKVYQFVPPKLMSLEVDKRLIALFDVYGQMLNGEAKCDDTIKHYRDRVDNAEFDIEKTYIYHRLSELCIRYQRPEESQRFARDAFALADKCNSNVWRYLAHYNIIRVDALKQSYHNMENDLQEFLSIANQLDKYAMVFAKTAVRSFEDLQAAQG